jgi:hypothetical protein
MPVTRPFKRTCRQLADGSYANSGNGQYVRHSAYAATPRQYIRAVEILQKDVLELFDYVEPADINRCCYSYRIHELHTRACIEIEANCKAILSENGYTRPGDWNMGDYKKIEQSHRLSSYQVRFPYWHGANATRTPFGEWRTGDALRWYQAYNATKHSRHENFQQANFENLMDAMCGLVTILASQFYTDDFGQAYIVAERGASEGFEYAIGGYFLVKFPNDWAPEDRYSFDWQQLGKVANPIQTFLYPL